MPPPRSRPEPRWSQGAIRGSRRATRWSRHAGLLAALAVGSVTCAPAGEPSAGDGCEWRGTITTQGDVTTVRNEAGSVWCGPARLVEELSIGVEEGAEQHMFGRISDVAVHGDRIIVLDAQVPAVRTYSLEDGRYLGDLGRQGEGPGEYLQPAELAVGPDGAVHVKDRQRLVVFPADGSEPRTWTSEDLFSFSLEFPLVVTPGGTVYAPNVVERVGMDLSDWVWGMFPIRPGGAADDPVTPPEIERVFEPEPARYMEGELERFSPPPFSPRLEWVMTPSGAIVAGIGDRYRIEVERRDGSTLVIEKAWDRVSVDPDEAAWHLRSRVASIRSRVGGFTWNGADVPGHKPAFNLLIPDHDGSLWVVRPGPGERLRDCVEESDDAAAFRERPCWRDTKIVDVFGAGGRYLGRFEGPLEIMATFPRPWIRGATVVAPIVDEAGTILLKRWRLVTAEEEGS